MKKTKSKSKRYIRLANKYKRLFIVVAIGVIGSVLLLTTKASPFTTSFEPEANAPSDMIVSASTASGGRNIKFKDNKPQDTSTFTLVSVPDTQAEVQSQGAYPRFTNRIQWLISNKDKLNIKYVLQVGDLQDWDDATHSHYERASSGLKLLEQAKVPYALSVGNHDTSAVCAGGSACPGISVPTAFREIPTWDKYYPPSRFPGIKTLCDEFNTYSSRLMAVGPSGTGLQTPSYVRDQCNKRNSTSSAYRTFTAGGVKWLMINYEMWPRQVVQEWMKSVIERHPDHNVILFSHMHLNGNSSDLTTDFGGYGSPQGSPKAVYDNVISQYSNVKFTFNGHTGGSGCATFTGKKGNKIYSYLNNRLSSSPTPNHVRLIKINVSDKSFTSEEYVPQNGTYLNQSQNASSTCSGTNMDWVK